MLMAVCVCARVRACVCLLQEAVSEIVASGHLTFEYDDGDGNPVELTAESYACFVHPHTRTPVHVPVSLACSVNCFDHTLPLASS